MVEWPWQWPRRARNSSKEEAEAAPKVASQPLLSSSELARAERGQRLEDQLCSSLRSEAILSTTYCSLLPAIFYAVEEALSGITTSLR